MTITFTLLLTRKTNFDMASERLTISEKDRKASNIKNRTKCALENINTTKKLKDNFPEAYVILTETSKEDVKRNECDNIEKLRAELSKL